MKLSSRVLGAAALGSLIFGSGIARADVFVYADINKTKDITVTETITVTKTIDLSVDETIFVDSAAENDIVKNQRNQYNYVQDNEGASTAEITGSGGTLSGIANINQAPGYINNQGNEVSVTYTEGFASLVHSQASVEQTNGEFVNNPPSDSHPPVSVDGDFFNVYELSAVSSQTDLIGGSFGGASGVIGINQAAGNLNNQNNAAAIAVGRFAVYALGEADLGQFNTGGFVNVAFQTRSDTISGSFGAASGIVQVNQSAGSLNNQANVVQVAVTSTATLPFTTPAP
jgi:hypothetical protein